MRHKISVVRCFLVGTAGIGAAIWLWALLMTNRQGRGLSLSLPLNSPWSPLTVGFFLLLEIVSAAIVIVVPGRDEERTSHTLASVGRLAAIVVLPGYLAVVTMGLAAGAVQLLHQPIGRRRAWQFTVFNIGNYVIGSAVGAGVFAAFGGRKVLAHPNLPTDALRIGFAVLGSIAVSYLCSYILFATSIWLVQRAIARREGRTVSARHVSAISAMKETFLNSHRNTILPEATASIVGILFGYLWIVNPPLAPIALLPIAVIFIAFKNFARLRDLDRLKSNFITEVSHELRTPLASILASTELLYHHAAEMEPENVRDLSRSSYESTNHLFRVVENLLNASTIQSGTLTVNPVVMSVDELVSDAVTQVEPFFESKKQRLDVNLPHDLPEVLADPRHMVQVLINLLTNASKYSPDHTAIRIVAASQDSVVRVSVIDEGMGIPPQEQTNIFERFYRVPSNTMTSVVGSGLGLTIVKSLVEMHHGEVGVLSDSARGSTFWFTLPQASLD